MMKKLFNYILMSNLNMIYPGELEPWMVVYYIPFEGSEERERWVVSSLCEDTAFVFVRYTEGSTAARTAIKDLIR